MNVRRTYKTGLRAPDCLIEGVSWLVREREILRYLEKHTEGDLLAFCKHKSGLDNPPPTLKDRYRQLFHLWQGHSHEEIVNALRTNESALFEKKTRHPVLNARHFTRNDIRRFSDTATPAPSLISLHDYGYLARESLKMICAHLDSIARDVINDIPDDMQLLVDKAMTNALAKGNVIKERSLYHYPEKAIAYYLERKSNLELTAFEQVAAAMESYRDMRGKVDFVRRLLFPPVDKDRVESIPDFSDVIPVLLYTYSIPRYFRNYLARTWEVDLEWVRNTLVGWRRKIDPLLPKKCQVEPLVELMSLLARHAKNHIENDEQFKVIGLLEKKRVLHLLVQDINLKALLPKDLHIAYLTLKEKIHNWPVNLEKRIASHTTHFTVQEVIEAAMALQRSVEGTLAGLPADSTAARNCRTFIKKINLISSTIDDYELLLTHYLPGNRYTGSVARLLSSFLEGVKKRGISRLFTALRGMITLAFASQNGSATAKFESVLIPGNCVTRPYTSSKRNKKFLPLNLIFNKYIVLRKEHPKTHSVVSGKRTEKFLNNKAATKLLGQGNPIWLGISIYSPAQFNATTRRLSGKRKGVFWFQLLPTKPIIKRIQRGAQLESIRLNVPRGPTRKIVADVILSAKDAEVFAKSGEFIRALDKQYRSKPFPQGDYLGCDWNKLGGNALVVGTEKDRIDLRRDGNLMEGIEAAASSIKALRKEVGLLQRAIATKNKDNKSKKGRQESQLTLLHQKIARIKKQAEKELLMRYLYMVWRIGAKHVGWDAITVSTRGRRGKLANVISDMPKRQELFEEFVEWAKDLKQAGILPNYQATIPITPYTGQMCDECLATRGKMKRSGKKDTPYDTFNCVDCGTEGNRHQVSARVSALILKQKVEAKTLADS